MNYLQFIETIELSMIYSLVTIGVFLTFRVTDFPDLTVDGSFPLGAAVCAVMLTSDFDPYLALLISFIAGAISGYITGLVNVHGKIMDLLSGILTMSALYSINLRIMKQPNISINTESTIFAHYDPMLLLCGIVFVIVAIIIFFLNSEIGLALRASGINPKSTSAQGVHVNNMKILSLSVSNGLVAFAGALFAQKLGFADISMGAGTIIIGLASVIIGEKFFKKNYVFGLVLNCLIGSLLYRSFITLALNSDFLGLEASDLNLVTSLIVIFSMVVPFYSKNFIKRFKK